MATPAIPAIPEPRPKVSMLIRSGLIPIDAAMAGFWVTARTSSPSRVRLRISHSAKKKRTARMKIATRMELMDTTSFSATDPASQSGGVSGWVSAPKIKPHDLLQRDGDPEGRQKRLERAVIEPSYDQPLHGHAGHEGDDEGQRDRDGERGRLVRHETLHEVARIGADHDELAMGHVDDPHDAESDGEPDGGEKVDRSERYSVEREVEEPVETDARLDPVQRLARSRGDGGAALVVDLEEHEPAEALGDIGLGRRGRGDPGLDQCGIGPVACAFGVQGCHGDAADFAIHDVRGKGGHLIGSRDQGGGEPVGHQHVIGVRDAQQVAARG